MAKTRVGKYTVLKHNVGGVQQALLAADDDKNLPLALILHGGPGEAMAPFLSGLASLENKFTLCVWEQRGAGLSYSKTVPKSSMTIEQFVNDTVEVIEIVLKKYGRKKLYLIGFSWGSLLGILAAQKAPHLIEAYLGVGQIANQLKSEQEAFDLVLERAKKAGDKKSVDTLNEVGRPPYPEDGTMPALLKGRKIFRLYNETPGKKVSMAKFFASIYKCPFYTLGNKLNYFKALMGAGDLFLQVLKVNLFEQVPKLDIPVYVVNGKFDLQTMPQIASEYINALEAPYKEFFLFENAGHSAHEDEPNKFIDVVNKML